MSFEYFLINFVLFLALVAEAHRPYSIDADKLATHTEITKRCGANAGFQKRTHRALRRRELSIDVNNDETTYEVHAKAPKHDFIKDWTNILTPEVTNGPYFYPRSQTLRQDIREGEPGVPLSLEIGVIDTNTCAPMKGVLVDIWVCRVTLVILGP
ncbi:hypothetical protein QQS21_000161 [Conoideocrella luteorostrata]|uniref:Uncharacterized protein n=1 Tax=Conoideocrella luteorostrata TaxID=1105319 RepID=A0AAJ0D1W3_9HYPO|nr:hypothetical protein QQS21_000161 [Conoideocrella luteorostrata]